MNKDQFNAIARLVGLGALTLTLVIQDRQIRDLNARVWRLEAQENLRSFGEMVDSLTTRKKED